MRYFIILALILLAANSAESLTITVGGNMEETAIKSDHITTDICSALYICNAVNYVSQSGKAGVISQGVFVDENLKAVYAKESEKSEYAEFTEKASWAQMPFSEETALSSAFSAGSVYHKISDNAYHAPLAFGADTAPAADESLVATEGAGTVINVRQTDIYSSAGYAAATALTNSVILFDEFVEDAKTAEQWWRLDDPKTRY